MKKRINLVVALLVAMMFIVSACAQPKQNDLPGGKEIEQGSQDQDATNNAEDDSEEAKNEEAAAQMVKDNAPEGCPSCHQQTGDTDRRLSAEIKEIEGHPELKEDATVNDCMLCHATGDRAFKKVLHRVHLIEGEHYTEKYDHNCINCHQISDEGAVTVKGLQQQQ